MTTIYHAYSSSEFFELYWHELQNLFLQNANSSLQLLNIAIIRWACSILNIQTPLFISSDIPKRETRAERLIDIINHFNSKYYLSPYGSRDYLIEDQYYFHESSINVYLQVYKSQPYKQIYDGFTEGTCFLDLLFNCGPNAYNIIKSGSRSPIALSAS